MKNRFTKKDLEADIAICNERLERAGHKFRLVQGHRNGYMAVDLATPEQVARHCCQSMLIAGTTRECAAECFRYVVSNT